MNVLLDSDAATRDNANAAHGVDASLRKIDNPNADMPK